MSWPDALMSACALFSLKSPSWLAFDQDRTADKVPRVSGIGRGPGDTRMRESLAPVEPEAVRPRFKHVFGALQRGKALEERGGEGHDLFALAGTGYFSSQQIHCDSGVAMHHRNGTSPSRHPMLGAALMPPGRHAGLPLLPEPIGKQDGTDKNDCAREAAKGLLGKLRRGPPHLKGIVTADRRSATAPHLAVLPRHNLHDIGGGQAGDHASLFEHVEAAARAGRGTYDNRHDEATGLHHRFRVVNAVPLHASHAELRVNVLACGERDGDKGHHCRWMTDLRVKKGTGYQLMRGGRARWRIDHETCNTLKNQGYHFAPNDGHGSQHLSVGFAGLLLLAFFVAQVQPRCCPLCHAVWATLGSKRRLWEKRRALGYAAALASMPQLWAARLYGLKKPPPIFAVDSSSSASRLGRCVAFWAMEPPHVPGRWWTAAPVQTATCLVPSTAAMSIVQGASKATHGGSNGAERCLHHRSYRMHRI